MAGVQPFDCAFVFGAGAVGSFLGAKLAAVLPTTLVGRAAHVEAMNRDGLRLTGELDTRVPVEAVTELPDIPPHALVIAAVKLRDIERAAEEIAPAARDDTVVLVLQNGLDPDARMREAVRRAAGTPGSALGRTEGADRGGLKVLRMLTTCGCNLARPGEVEYWGGGVTFPDSEEAAPVAELFRRAGVEVTIEREFERAAWTKFAVNCVANPLSAILNVRNRQIVTPELAGVRRAIVEEVRDAARESGVELEGTLAETVDRGLAASDNRNSMLQDIAYGRPTEIGELNERVVEIARAHGREAPANATLSRLVRFLEGRARTDNRAPAKRPPEGQPGGGREQ